MKKEATSMLGVDIGFYYCPRRKRLCAEVSVGRNFRRKDIDGGIKIGEVPDNFPDTPMVRKLLTQVADAALEFQHQLGSGARDWRPLPKGKR